MKKLMLLLTFFAAFATVSMAQTKKTVKNKSAKATKTTKLAATPVNNAGTINTQTTKAAVAGAVAEFQSTEIDYGKIKQGSEPLRVFSFKNVGSEPLIITNAQGSCGCTVPTWPKEPIMPGQTSKIEVRYDTQRTGPFSKSITLTTNEANPTRVLSIKGDVETAPAPANGAPAAAPSTLEKGK